MIQIKDLNKVYDNGSYAVKDFNLDIEDNEFVVFVDLRDVGNQQRYV